MQTNKKRKLFYFRMPKYYDRWIHTSVLLLIFIGTLMVISTSVGETYKNNTIVIKTIAKQCLFVFASYMAMIYAANLFQLEKVMRWARHIGIVVLILLGGCFFFTPVNGARAWIRIAIPGLGEMTLQPSEFMKVYMIVLMACIVERVNRRNYDTWTIVKTPISFFVIAAILIYFQNDVGSLMVLALICAFCVLIPSHPNLKQLQKWIAILMIAGTVFLIFFSTIGLHLLEKVEHFPVHMLERFQMAANPWLDEYDAGMQLINSLYAFATGGWSGLGLGQSIQKLAYLPEAMTDYILAIVVEELGIGGFLVILGGYCILIFRLFRYALYTKKDSYKILYVGTAIYLFVHFLLNVGGVSGLIPLTGVPLLFISSGASSLMSICVALGICQATCSHEERERNQIK